MKRRSQINISKLEPGSHLPPGSGGKAVGLNRIIAEGLDVPPTWIVLPASSDEEIRNLSLEIETEGITSVAVRSSGAEEDNKEHSFAGIHETKLGISPQNLLPAVRKVADSVFSRTASEYRKNLELDTAVESGAVLVQAMVQAESAGVAFGLSGVKDRLVIEAVEGLGEAAVQGIVTPEKLTLTHTSTGWCLNNRQARWQPFSFILTEGRIKQFEIPKENQGTQILNNDSAAFIADGVQRLQKKLSEMLDVEWAIEGDQVYFLQARPQSRPLDPEIPPGRNWTRVNVREILPDLPSAFSRSTFPHFVDAGFKTVYKKLGLKNIDDLPILQSVHGRPVFDEDLIFLPADKFGMPRRLSQIFLGDLGEESDAKFIAVNYFKALRHPIFVYRSVKMAFSAEKLAEKFIQETRLSVPKADTLSLADINDEELLMKAETAIETFLSPFAFHAQNVASAVGSAHYGIISMIKEIAHPGAVISMLTAGGEPTVTTRQIDDLVSVAVRMRSWPGSREFLTDMTESHTRIACWKTNLPKDIWEGVRAWLEKYGHRGPFESDLAMPRYNDDLRLFGGLLAPLVLSGEGQPEPQTKKARRERISSEAWDKVNQHLGILGRYIFRKRFELLKKLMALRENLRNEGMAAMAVIRSYILELGRRLVDRENLDRVENIWHLSLEEIKRACSDLDFDAQIAVQREISRQRAWRHIKVPNRFSSDDIPNFSRETGVPILKGKTMFGNGISPGVAEGEVFVIQTPQEGFRRKSGSILVTAATDPGWTPLFSRAIGIVTELGGILSHAGIVAREYGLPCVSNVKDVTSNLKDGDIIRIDGTIGSIEIIS